MDIDRRALCGFATETHFDVRENQGNVVQMAVGLLFKNLFINGSTVIVGNSSMLLGQRRKRNSNVRIRAGKSYKLLLGIARQFAPGQLALCAKNRYRFCKLEARFA